MLDHIRCEYPLPDGHDPQGVLFETRDLDNMGSEFVITPLGRLVSDRWHYAPLESDEGVAVDEESMYKVIGSMRVIDETNVDCEHHGEIDFYHQGADGVRRSYTATFDEGRLMRIVGGFGLKSHQLEDAEEVDDDFTYLTED